MATIKMKKGNVYADICNDPECIANAKEQGYSVVTETVKPKEENAGEVAPKKTTSKKSVK